MAVVFTVVKTVNQSRLPSTEEWITTTCYMSTMGYYAVPVAEAAGDVEGDGLEGAHVDVREREVGEITPPDLPPALILLLASMCRILAQSDISCSSCICEWVLEHSSAQLNPLSSPHLCW